MAAHPLGWSSQASCRIRGHACRPSSQSCHRPGTCMHAVRAGALPAQGRVPCSYVGGAGVVVQASSLHDVCMSRASICRGRISRGCSVAASSRTGDASRVNCVSSAVSSIWFSRPAGSAVAAWKLLHRLLAAAWRVLLLSATCVLLHALPGASSAAHASVATTCAAELCSIRGHSCLDATADACPPSSSYSSASAPSAGRQQQQPSSPAGAHVALMQVHGVGC